VDDVDRRLVDALRTNGRETYADLARRVGLSAPAVHDRVSKLESSGVITGFHAAVDTTTVGLGVTAMIGIQQTESADQAEVIGALGRLAEVESCWFVAGDEAFLLLVRVPDVAALEHTLGRVTSIKGVGRTRTTVVLSTKWEGRVRPIDNGQA
jgi:Lrp/AsnC family leucine-responsive transcriptional regulator